MGGLFFGVVNGVFRPVELLADSSIQMIRNIPHLAMIPLVIHQGTIDLDVSINLPRPRDLTQTELAVLKQRILQRILSR